jgi:O-succinylbenzoic acid--CoA ligase
VLKLLQHIQARECEGRLCFSGPSLLSVYAYLEDRKVQFADPKIHGWLRSEDRGTIQHGELKIRGRVDAVFKVGGESIDLAHLEHHLHTLQLQYAVKGDLALIALPDARLGHAIHLAFSRLNREELVALIEQFQQSVLPFERIRNMYFVEQFPRSSLGKILKNELVSLVMAASACSAHHCSKY